MSMLETLSSVVNSESSLKHLLFCDCIWLAHWFLFPPHGLKEELQVLLHASKVKPWNVRFLAFFLFAHTDAEDSGGGPVRRQYHQMEGTLHCRLSIDTSD